MLSRPDSVTDLWKTGSHPLDPVLMPRSVAVIGATERPGSVGRIEVARAEGLNRLTGEILAENHGMLRTTACSACASGSGFSSNRRQNPAFYPPP